MRFKQLHEEIGEHIKRNRKAAKLSQSACAKLIKVHQTAFHRIETGQQQITLAQAAVLCRGLGLSVYDIAPEDF